MCSQAGDGHETQEHLAQSHAATPQQSYGWKPQMSQSPWVRQNELKNQNLPAAFCLARSGTNKPNVSSISKNLTFGLCTRQLCLGICSACKGFNPSPCYRSPLCLLAISHAPFARKSPLSQTGYRRGAPAVAQRPGSLTVPSGHTQSLRAGTSHRLLRLDPAAHTDLATAVHSSCCLLGSSLPYPSHTFFFPLSLDLMASP